MGIVHKEEEGASAKALGQEGAWHTKELKDNVWSTRSEAERGEMSLEPREMKARAHLTCPGPSLGFALYLKADIFPSVK